MKLLNGNGAHWKNFKRLINVIYNIKILNIIELSNRRIDSIQSHNKYEKAFHIFGELTNGVGWFFVNYTYLPTLWQWILILHTFSIA